MGLSGLLDSIQMRDLVLTLQSKQEMIHDLLGQVAEKDDQIAHAVEEKEQELMIMQEGMDTTLKELSEMRLVSARLF